MVQRINKFFNRDYGYSKVRLRKFKWKFQKLRSYEYFVGRIWRGAKVIPGALEPPVPLAWRFIQYESSNHRRDEKGGREQLPRGVGGTNVSSWHSRIMFYET